MLTCEHLTLVGADLAPGIQVALIADEHDRHVWVPVLFDFLEPACQVRESVSASDVIDEKGSGRAAIIRPRDRFE